MMKSKSSKNKVKVPKIEINECKMKTRDPKKLETEMINQAKEAKLLLEKLLSENKDMVSRTRSASLNASVENLILSNRKRFNKKMKARGSVPNIGNISKKLLFGHKATIADCHSQPVSPTMSPGSSRRNQFIINPIKFVRKYNSERADSHTERADSPLSKTEKHSKVGNNSDKMLHDDSQTVSIKKPEENGDCSLTGDDVIEKLI